MVRLKGANSDYEYSVKTNGIIDKTKEEKGKPDPLYLQIFICPYDMPSQVEPNDGKFCQGTDKTCPNKDKRSGHAAISLHQKDGISLVTDNNSKLLVDQEGAIQLIPASGKVVIKRDKQPNINLTLSDQGFEIKQENGAVIRFDVAGNIELVPAINKTVTVKGNLTIEKEINGELSAAMKQKLIQEIKQSLNK
jgi:hypothetical protein